MTIDILCKVVDNYGDIGVVYRLAKALSDLEIGLRLRLIVDDLGAFQALCPEVDPSLDLQRIRDWVLLRWDKPWTGMLYEPPRFVLECFACGRPDWYEKLLFAPNDPTPRLVLNIEHLTAESWADDFHLLPAATRSILVKKWFFMPGFTPATGGLIIDRRFREACRLWDEASNTGAPHLCTEDCCIPPARAALRRELARSAGLALSPGAEERFWISIFSYERDYGRIVRDLASFDRERPLLALVASGRSQACFLEAWQEAGKPFPVLVLPFLPQELWDDFLLGSDFSIVRGEESLARAALSGRPFLWHAYLQEGAHQLVKVQALLERLRRHFRAEDFALYETLSLAFNDRSVDDPSLCGAEDLLPLLLRERAIRGGFRAFGQELFDHGDLAQHLVTFFRDFV